MFISVTSLYHIRRLVFFARPAKEELHEKF
jgi:hypothetical protein